MRFITAVQLTRLTMAFGAVSDIWFVILYTKGCGDQYVFLEELQGMPTALALMVGAVVAVGLFAYGAALNDVLDVRHDAMFSPSRPIPAGRIRLGQAIVVTIGSLILASLAAAALGKGALCIALLTAAGLLFYNAAGKFIPAAGIVTVGLIHAAHMLIPNYQLEFTLPLWLVFTHTMVIAALAHHLEEKRPRLTPRAWMGIAAGWVSWSALFIAAGVFRGGLWPLNGRLSGIAWPIAAALAFAGVAWWKTRGVSGTVAAEKLKRYGAMWQSLYGAAWLMSVGLHAQAAFIGGLALVAFAVMTAIKELVGLTGRPLAYRG
jgi:4-hydroxybenzoate polyprenyltransferase